MAEKKKKQTADFEKDKTAFAGGSSAKKGGDAKKQSRNSPAHTSRGTGMQLLDIMSRSRKVTIQKVKRRAAFRRNKAPLRRTAGSRRKKQETITAARILTTRTKKRADTAGGSIRAGNTQKTLISGVISRRRTAPLQRRISLLMEKSRNPRAAES